MATSPRTIYTYPLDGSTQEFDINFEYLTRRFVTITLIGEDRKVLTMNTDYRFVTRTKIRTTIPWGPGQGYNRIEIRRITSATDRLVDFSDGSILRAYDLNLANIQSLHIAEEARDISADTLGVDVDGNLDARGRRIINLGAGKVPADAVSMQQLREWEALNKASGRWLPAGAIAPTERLNGDPLEFDDRWYDTVAKTDKRWTGMAWEAVSVDTALLASPEGAKHVGIVLGQNVTTVEEAIKELYSLDAPTSFMTFATPEAVTAATVPEGIYMLGTVGSFAGSSKGGQLFVKDNSTTRVIDGKMVLKSADGSKWVHMLKPHLSNFGNAWGGDITDALEKFIKFSETYAGPMDWTGKGTVSRQIVGNVNDEANRNFCQQFDGHLRIKQHASIKIGTALTLMGYIQTVIDNIEIVGDVSFSSRNIGTGLRFYLCKYLIIRNAYVMGCRRWGVDMDYYTTECSHGKITTLYNGTFEGQAAPWQCQQVFPYGTHLAQREVLSGVILPAGTEIGDAVVVNNNYYDIRLVDTAGRVDVFPQMSPQDRADAVTKGVWYTGGGMRHQGEDTNACFVSHFSGLMNSRDVIGADLYPISFGKFATQLSGASIVIGQTRDKATRGGMILDAYVESPKFFMVQIGQAGDSPYTIGNVGPFEVTGKAYLFMDYKDADGSVHPARQVPNVKTEFNQRTVAPLGYGTLNDSSFRAVASTQSGNTHMTTVIVGDTWGREVFLDLNRNAFEAHGRRSVAVFLTSTTGTMSGTVRFRALPADHKVMSAGYKDITVTGPVVVYAVWNNNNWYLSTGPVHTSA